MVILKWIGIVILIVVVALFILGVSRFYTLGKQSQDMNPELGVSEGSFQLCPDKPNCVNSFQQDSDHGIAPLPGGIDEFRFLTDYIAGLNESDLKHVTDNYLWATYQSKTFGFVDDLELYYDGEYIQVRSASRVGYSDMDANRERVEALRELLQSR